MTSAITNNQSLPQCQFCHTDLKEDLIKRCSRCKTAIYCGHDCQKKDWTKHKVTCREFIDTTTPYTKENEEIRRNFSRYETHILKSVNLPKNLAYLKEEEFNHVIKTQKAILQGSGHLNSDTSVVVVCGAQFYQDKFVEPLPQLLERCNKLILVDVDPVTLEKLHIMLGSSAKVSKVVLDLTCELKNLPAFWEASAKSNPEQFISNIGNFLETANQNATKRAPGLPGVLGDAASADYVISSLVASQLSFRLKEALFSLFTTKFNSHISTAMKPPLFDKLYESLQQNIHALTIKHTEDLCAWAGEKGRVYFADTYKMDATPLVADRTLKEVAQILKKGKGSLTKGEWHWNIDESNDYSVMSLLS